MPRKRSEKPPSDASTSETTAEIPPDKPSKAAWKTGEQLEYMLSQWSLFIDHQNAGTLSRFWPRIYDHWYKTWPIIPTAQSIEMWGSSKEAKAKLLTENNKRIRTWYHNQARPNSRAAKSDLRLSQSEKRKLARAQAYCAYAWDSGLREIVIARWAEQKQSHMSSDEDDPVPGSVGPGASIPINFKLKIAKEVYNSLSVEEKKQVDDRRQEDRMKLYRSIADIPDVGEREKKLCEHKKNQPAVSKSLLRVLKNLEDQAGCVAQLFVASVDPKSGKMTFQNFCQGKTEAGLDFHAFCGDDWDETIYKRFGEWALGIFGDKGSVRRSVFTLPDGSHSGQGAASSSAEGILQSGAVEGSIEPPPGTDATIIDEDEATQVPSAAPIPQSSEITQAFPSQTPILVNDQPPTAMFHYSGSSVPPQIFETPQFVTPQEIFGPIESNEGSIVSRTVTESPLVPLSPVLELAQTAAPPRVNPNVPEPSHLVAPPLTLGTPQVVIPHQAVVSPILSESPSLVVPHPLLEFSQTVVPHQAIAAPPRVITADPQELVDVFDPPHVIHNSQTDYNSSAVIAAEGGYKLQPSVTPTARSRHDSIEGAPDITLTLGRSGYELTAHPLQPDIPTTPSTTSSPTTSPPGRLVVPSLRRSSEELLTTPVDAETSLPDTPGESFSSHSEPSTTTTPSEITILPPKTFFSAPRVVPTYSIDRSDLPSWLLERGRLDYILSVEAGDIWMKLITTWLRQERRLCFGVNEKIGANLSLSKKPEILKGYFKWHHNPSKGDEIILPEFGDEMAVWWANLQPSWRYKDEFATASGNDYSYILAGGKKGVFLLVLCLAWWDRAHGRNLEKEKDRRREAARAAGKDGNTLDFGDLHEHEYKWFNIVNDLIFVLELAQGWPVPGESTPDAAGSSPTKRKRAAKGSANSPRKKQKQKSS